MKVLGITGGIGAGKSAVLSCLARDFGAFVLEADKVGHRLMEPEGVCYEQVVSLFGKNVLKNDKTIDRRYISDIVFSREDMLQKLNGIIHPAVKEYIREQIKAKKKEGCPLFVVEAALLLEADYQDICDAVWYVHADRDIRIRRLMENRGYTKEKSEEIMKSQLPEEYFRTHTDRTIDNSGELGSTCRQIEEGVKTL